MKKAFLSTILLFSFSLLFAQSHRQPPTTVQQSWQKEHSGVNNAQWQQSNGQWHARYKDPSTNRDVDTYYDKRGRQIESRSRWDRKDVPQDLDKKIRSKYHTNNYEVTRIDRPNSTSLFQIILNLGKTKRTIYTDENGNVTRYSGRH